MSGDNIVKVSVPFDRDQFDFLEEVAKSLRVGVDEVIRNAVIGSLLASSYPKDEARLQYVTAQARTDKWRQPHKSERGVV
jgi:hypothetical protein